MMSGIVIVLAAASRCQIACSFSSMFRDDAIPVPPCRRRSRGAADDSFAARRHITAITLDISSCDITSHCRQSLPRSWRVPRYRAILPQLLRRERRPIRDIAQQRHAIVSDYIRPVTPRRRDALLLRLASYFRFASCLYGDENARSATKAQPCKPDSRLSPRRHDFFTRLRRYLPRHYRYYY